MTLPMNAAHGLINAMAWAAALVLVVCVVALMISEHNMRSRSPIPAPRKPNVVDLPPAAYIQTIRRTHRRREAITTTTWVAIALALLMTIVLTLAPWILP